MIIIAWLFFCIIVGMIGSGRNIGFVGAFLLSLILSPLIGGIITLCSGSKATKRHNKEMLAIQKEIASKVNNKPSVADELEKISRLRQLGHLTEQEYTEAKAYLMK